LPGGIKMKVKSQNIVTAILVVLVLFWIGGWMMGLMRHMLYHAIRLTVLALIALVVVQLATGRRR